MVAPGALLGPAQDLLDQRQRDLPAGLLIRERRDLDRVAESDLAGLCGDGDHRVLSAGGDARAPKQLATLGDQADHPRVEPLDAEAPLLIGLDAHLCWPVAAVDDGRARNRAAVAIRDRPGHEAFGAHQHQLAEVVRLAGDRLPLIALRLVAAGRGHGHLVCALRPLHLADQPSIGVGLAQRRVGAPVLGAPVAHHLGARDRVAVAIDHAHRQPHARVRAHYQLDRLAAAWIDGHRRLGHQVALARLHGEAALGIDAGDAERAFGIGRGRPHEGELLRGVHDLGLGDRLAPGIDHAARDGHAALERDVRRGRVGIGHHHLNVAPAELPADIALRAARIDDGPARQHAQRPAALRVRGCDGGTPRGRARDVDARALDRLAGLLVDHPARQQERLLHRQLDLYGLAGLGRDRLRGGLPERVGRPLRRDVRLAGVQIGHLEAALGVGLDFVTPGDVGLAVVAAHRDHDARGGVRLLGADEPSAQRRRGLERHCGGPVGGEDRADRAHAVSRDHDPGAHPGAAPPGGEVPVGVAGQGEFLAQLFRHVERMGEPIRGALFVYDVRPHLCGDAPAVRSGDAAAKLYRLAAHDAQVGRVLLHRDPADRAALGHRGDVDPPITHQRGLHDRGVGGEGDGVDGRVGERIAGIIDDAAGQRDGVRGRGRGDECGEQHERCGAHRSAPDRRGVVPLTPVFARRAGIPSCLRAPCHMPRAQSHPCLDSRFSLCIILRR